MYRQHNIGHVITFDCFTATVDGGVGYLLPLTERVYRRLDMTQKLLYTTIQHTAGLNPKTFRYCN